MANALYRKYRPVNFSEVIGQEPVKIILKNAVKQGRVSHAYLFCGPRGVGKTTVARILARVVNCTNPEGGEPDGTCANCKALNEGRFLDLVEIDAASFTGVDNIREIIDHVKFAPSSGKFKVFIIDEVHMLSKAAFNALLKTLEEPPAHAIFILATTEIHKVPATIISRTQRFDFRAVSQAEILELFGRVLKEEKIELPLEAQKLIAQAAEGSLRDALSILDQVTSFGGSELTVEEVENILGITRTSVSQRFLDMLVAGDAGAAVAFAKNLAFEGRDLTQFTKNFLEYLRMVLFIKMQAEGARDSGLVAEDRARLEEQAKNINAARLLEIIKAMIEAYRETKGAPVPELPLLSAVLELVPEARVSKKEPAGEGKAEDQSVDIALGGVIDRWADVLAKIKEYNHSLISSLRLGRVVRLEGRDLVLAFPYNFHKETIDARKNRIVVEQVLEEVYGKNLRIKVYVERELESAPINSAAPDLLGEAMRVLGEKS